MSLEIGIKQGITYYCECKHMASILNPVVDNKVNMRYTGFFDEMWNEYNIGFDTFGYGLKKTRANKGIILCDDASKCFGTTRGYVGMVLTLNNNIQNGVYETLYGRSTYLNEYLLWGVNIGNTQTSYPTIYAKLTDQGIEFTIWTIYGQYTIVDSVSNVYAGNKALYEFIWDADPMDDFMMSDFDATMAIRVNGEDATVANYPIGTMDLSGLNFCALDSPLNYYNLDCVIGKLVLSNEVPNSVKNEWHSSSTSSSSGDNAREYYYDNLIYSVISQDPTMTLVSYTDIDAISQYLQLTTSERKFKHLWLPNSGTGNSLSKIDITDTLNPIEVGRYLLSTSGDDPSRTVVVPPGDCWVASRNHGTVTKVGLTEASHCRNTCLQTSSNSVALTYGTDDAVLYYFDIATESMKYPSTPPSTGGAIRGLNDDVNNNIWVGGSTGNWYKISGDGGLTNGSITKYSSLISSGSYGSVCSYKNNYIWSARLDHTGVDFFSADDPINTTGDFQNVETYGISYSRGFVYVGDYLSYPDATSRRVVRINCDAAEYPDDYPIYATTFMFRNVPLSVWPRHFAVLTNNDSEIDADRTEDLYINWYGGYLGVIRNHKQYSDGIAIEIDWNTFEKYNTAVSDITGVGVMYDLDSNPFVWVINSSSTNVQTFDPSINQFVIFDTSGATTTPLGATYHYNYTNFTGTVDEGDVYPITGTAIYIIDSLKPDSRWEKVCLTMDAPSGSSLTLSASASNNHNSFSQAVEFTNCEDLSSLNFVGRYLRVILQFTRQSQSDPSPTVRDMDVQFTEVLI